MVHRSDGSGTTNIFTNYLSKVSSEWKEKVGSSTAVNWPGDVGGKGNEGVANSVKQIPGGIGYVEVAYAKQNKLPWAAIRNKAGKFLEPSLEGAAAAADQKDLPDDMKVMITDSANPAAYPSAVLLGCRRTKIKPTRQKRRGSQYDLVDGSGWTKVRRTTGIWPLKVSQQKD